MRALLATNQMLMWSGSELVVLELCEALRRRGHEVVVFCNHWEGALRAAVEAAGAEPTDAPEQVRLFDFDWAWVQHHTGALLDLSVDERSRRRTTLVFAHLSPHEPLESPGFVLESSIADVVACNSEETREAVVDSSLARPSVRIFPNPAPGAFFDAARPPAGTLRRLAVVSNHVPAEVRGALALLADRHGVQCATYGAGEATFVRITPELLRLHDAVLTIGKTVQYALALRLPVYCYDQFGGPGYLTEATFERAARFNFSGRCAGRRCSSEEIAAELLDGHLAARRHAVGVDIGRFRLEPILDALLAVPGTSTAEKAAGLQAAREPLARERRVAQALRIMYRGLMHQRGEARSANALLAEEQSARVRLEAELRQARLSAPASGG